MSDLATTPVYSLVNPPTAAGSDPQSTPGSASLASDFETFLKMLTAQAKYQDPLEPLDSSEYAAQLAQFSMVEQQVLTNENLTILHGQIATSNMQLLSGLIGLEARSLAPAFFDGQPITVSPNPAAVADTVNLVVRDADGTEVDRISLPVSADPFDWSGLDANGDLLPKGHYAFHVESWANGEMLLDELAATYAEIQEAQANGDQTIVIFAGGAAVPTDDISGLRRPVAHSS